MKYKKANYFLKTGKGLDAPSEIRARQNRAGDERYA